MINYDDNDDNDNDNDDNDEIDDNDNDDIDETFPKMRTVIKPVTGSLIRRGRWH